MRELMRIKSLFEEEIVEGTQPWLDLSGNSRFWRV
jgi:hypothetical protein